MANYSYLTQSIQSSCLILPKDIDSFYNPVVKTHTGFAWDGTYYIAGVQQAGPVYASWYNEGVSAYRGLLKTFPQAGLILLSKVALTILDESTSALTLWMQFLLSNNFALTDRFNSDLNGWTPSGLAYADGVLSVTYSPDAGNGEGGYGVTSNMVVHLDFSQDTAYLDVAI
jgi:hypothetical protein